MSNTIEKTMSVDRKALHALVKVIDKFSTDYFTSLSEENQNKNIVCSPIGTYAMLSMAMFGTRGCTEDEIRSVLQMPSNRIIKNGYQSLINIFDNFNGVELCLANKIYAASATEIKKEFWNISKIIFKSAIEVINFNEPKEASQIINLWCEKTTNNRVKNVVEPDDLNNAALVLINAIYFKGKWAETFDPARTSSQSFRINHGTTKEVLMMRRSGKFNFGRVNELDAQFLELPYEKSNIGDEVSMFIILPDELDGLRNIETNIDKIDFTSLRGPAHEADVWLPKFKVGSKFDLKVILQKMGIKKMFENTANFSGICDSPVLKVSKAVQKSFLEVNEEGSEAAVITGMQVMLMCMPVSIVINRPFICVIVEHISGTQLFYARIIDPTIT